MTDPRDLAACRTTDPDYFDMEFLYGAALAICATCPVRLWCLKLVDPAPSGYSGVAGGHAWSNGKPLPQYKTDLADPVLTTYLDTATRHLPLQGEATQTTTPTQP